MDVGKHLDIFQLTREFWYWFTTRKSVPKLRQKPCEEHDFIICADRWRWYEKQETDVNLLKFGGIILIYNIHFCIISGPHREFIFSTICYSLDTSFFKV